MNSSPVALGLVVGDDVVAYGGARMLATDAATSAFCPVVGDSIVAYGRVGIVAEDSASVLIVRNSRSCPSMLQVAIAYLGTAIGEIQSYSMPAIRIVRCEVN